MKLNFRKYGEGKPFIILHGLFGLSDNWQTAGKKLAEGYTVYLVDLRNHGHSPHSNEWSYEVMAGDILELMDDENIDKAVIMGHSMGGKTAMAFAEKHCSRLEKMIIVDIALRRYDPPRDVLQALNAVHLDTVKSRREVEEIVKFHVSDAGTIQFIMKNLYWDSDDRLAWRFNLEVISREIENVAVSPVISGICNVPVQVIYGERSSYVTEEDRNSLLEHFPNTMFSGVPDAGHWVHAENPAGFMAVLEEFLQKTNS